MKYRNAIVYGVLSGLAIIFYHLGFYFGNKEIIIGSWFFFSIYLLHVPFMVATGLKERSLNNGLIDFKTALREVFLTFLVGMFFYYAIYYALFNFDSEIIALQKQASMQGMEWQLEKGFIDEEQFDALKAAWETDNHNVTIWGVITGIPFRIIGGFLLSLLVASIVKR